MAMVIQATIALKSYNILLLYSATYVTHILALFFLINLVLTLFEWIGTQRNRILLLYGVSFSLTAVAIMTSLIYATYILSYQPTNIKPSSIHNSVIGLARADLAISFGRTLDGISILSFVSVWIASAVLLSTYARRIGNIRYWTIISIPLIYFLFPFETYFLNIFKPLMTSSPVEYGVINVLAFSATKQIGALFFSLAYFAASTLVANKEMQKYLWLTAIGMAILFGCMDFDSLLYAAYPPFGLVTVSFMPIGSYLVVTGLTLSATLLARDKELRKEFYNTAVSQLSLLKTIGVTEMEKELMKQYKSIDQRLRSLDKPTRFEKDNVKEALHGLVDEMDKEDAREILHDVLTELYSKPRSKSKS
jgi:hypothetical protein